MKVFYSIAVIAGSYIVIDQYQLFMQRRARNKAKEG